MEKQTLIAYLQTLFEQESFYSEKYGNSRCLTVDGWFCSGLLQNIIGEILEWVEQQEEEVINGKASL